MPTPSFVPLLCVTAQHVSALVPARAPRTVFLHLVSELGELAEEGIIRAGELNKPAGPDGVLGESCDALNCLLDLVWLAGNGNADTARDLTARVCKAAALPDWDGIAPVPFPTALTAFTAAISDLRAIHALVERPRWVARSSIDACARLLTAILVLAKAAEPDADQAQVLALFQAKCAKWRRKTLGQ